MGRLSGKFPIPRPSSPPQGEVIPTKYSVNGPLGFLQGHGIPATPTPSAPWKRRAAIKKSFLCVSLAKTLSGVAYEKKGLGALGALGSQSCHLRLSTTSCCVTLGTLSPSLGQSLLTCTSDIPSKGENKRVGPICCVQGRGPWLWGGQAGTSAGTMEPCSKPFLAKY